MVSQLYAVSNSTVALPAKAAAGESDRAWWENCFADLLDSGLLSFPAQPGCEVGVSAGGHARAASQGSIAHLCRQVLLPVLRANGRLCLDISGLSQEHIQIWDKQLRSLCRATGGQGTLGVSLGVGEPVFATDLQCIYSWLRGAGCVAVRYPVPENSTGALHRWQNMVYRSHTDIGIQPVPVSAVRPLSPLHTCEKGQAVMPTGLFDAPSLTAWLVIDLDARRLGDPFKVRRQLAHCLRFADNLIDTLDWPLPALRLDALLNRRVALRLTHVGDVLANRGMEPKVSGVFCRLQRWLVFIRDSFVHESMLLARLRGPFPDLCAGELVDNLRTSYGVADARRLVRNRMLRHRHLLALSPLDIFPDASWPGRAADWISLVPAIACADAITMAGPDIRTRLSVGDWERLLRLTAALAASAVGVKRARVRSTR